MPYPKQQRHAGPLIYRLTFPNGKSYIGQTVDFFEVRMTKHKSSSKHRETSGCIALNAAIRKYGWTNVQKEILLYCDEKDLDMFESNMIKLYDTLIPNGYNLLSGGNSNKSQSTCTREKMTITKLRKSIGNKTACISYGCLIKYKTRCGKSSTTYKYAILDHPLCTFKVFDTLDPAISYLESLNHELYIQGRDYSEYDCDDENNIGSDKTHMLMS